MVFLFKQIVSCDYLKYVIKMRNGSLLIQWYACIFLSIECTSGGMFVHGLKVLDTVYNSWTNT